MSVELTKCPAQKLSALGSRDPSCSAACWCLEPTTCPLVSTRALTSAVNSNERDRGLPAGHMPLTRCPSLPNRLQPLGDRMNVVGATSAFRLPRAALLVSVMEHCGCGVSRHCLAYAASSYKCRTGTKTLINYLSVVINERLCHSNSMCSIHFVGSSSPYIFIWHLQKCICYKDCIASNSTFPIKCTFWDQNGTDTKAFIT